MPRATSASPASVIKSVISAPILNVSNDADQNVSVPSVLRTLPACPSVGGISDPSTMRTQ